jgi:hypothetical protein
VRGLSLLGVVLVGVACAQPTPTAAPMPASSAFLADAGPGLSVVEASNGGAPLARSPEPGVLAEILAAAPTSMPSATNPNGGTLIGTETDTKPDQSSLNTLGSKGMASGPRVPKSMSIESGVVEVQGLPAHAAERTARAQFYYPLVMRCRDTAGQILPADAITLRFRVDEEGNVVPSSISAIAADPRHESAANCMRRELSAVAFRAPAALRGSPTTLRATIPSVD